VWHFKAAAMPIFYQHLNQTYILPYISIDDEGFNFAKLLEAIWVTRETILDLPMRTLYSQSEVDEMIKYQFGVQNNEFVNPDMINGVEAAFRDLSAKRAQTAKSMENTLEKRKQSMLIYFNDNKYLALRKANQLFGNVVETYRIPILPSDDIINIEMENALAANQGNATFLENFVKKYKASIDKATNDYYASGTKPTLPIQPRPKAPPSPRPTVTVLSTTYSTPSVTPPPASTSVRTYASEASAIAAFQRQTQKQQLAKPLTYIQSQPVFDVDVDAERYVTAASGSYIFFALFIAFSKQSNTRIYVPITLNFTSNEAAQFFTLGGMSIANLIKARYSDLLPTAPQNLIYEDILIDTLANAYHYVQSLIGSQ
jgi:hypothetical protein